jgi:nicotinate dehydrogenase subunit B
MPMRKSDAQSRRAFLKSGGALIVSFGAASLEAQGPFDTHPSHIDPKRLDSWLSVGADGSITANTGKCDFGQGMITAQTQLVAEELCVQFSRVKLIQCDTAVTPDQGTTSGSQSTPTNFNSQNLALAAATAREALLKMAADKLGTPIKNLSVADGVIVDSRGSRVTYQEIIGGKRFNLAMRASPGVRIGKFVPLPEKTSSLPRNPVAYQQMRNQAPCAFHCDSSLVFKKQ